jgi:hypothetical protein
LDSEWIWENKTNLTNRSGDNIPLKENPIEELTQIARKAISAEDYSTFQNVSDKLYNHLILLTERDKYQLGFLFSEYRDYIKNLFSISLKSEDIHFTIYLVNKRIDLEQFFLELNCLKHENPLWRTNLNYLSIDFELYIQKSMLIEDDAHFEEILSAYSSIGEYYINKIIPKELPEYDFQKFKDYSHIKYFVSKFLGSGITSITEKLSEAKSLNRFQPVFTFFYLQGTVLESSSSNSTKLFLIHVLETAKRDAFKVYIDSAPSRITYMFFPFASGHVFKREIKILNKCKTLNGLLWACEYALQRGKLNNLILNQLKASMLSLIDLNESEGINIKKPFVRCIDEYDKLRSNLENSTNIHDQDMYVKIHEYLIFLEKESKDKEVWDDEVKNKFIVTFTRFSKLEDFRKLLEESHYLRDEQIT